jgi:iron complex outermembrane receptor protein
MRWVLRLGLLLALGPWARARAEGLESITVTARRTEEDLQSTAEAVSAFSARDLEVRSIDQTKDLGLLAPNLRFENSPGTGTTAAVTIRGISQPDPLITGDPSVGIYLDGIYNARMVGGNFSLFDVERVEVLRGPQGTLYGKNTPAGAINVWSRQPGGRLGGYLRGVYGTEKRSELAGALDVPLLTETLAARIAFQLHDDDGYIDNHGAAGISADVGGGIGDQNGRGLRLSLASTPIEPLELSLQGERYRERRHSGFPNQLSFADPALVNPTVIDPAGFDELAWQSFAAATDADDAYLSFRGQQDLDVYGGRFSAAWDFGSAELKYLFGQRDYEFLNAMDLDGSPFALFHIGSPQRPGDEESRQSSHELMLNGIGLEDRLRYNAGLYFFDERSTSRATQFFGTAFGGQGLEAVGSVESRVRSWAAYAQGSFALGDRLDLTLGLRQTRERRAITRQTENCLGVFPCDVGVPPFDGSPDRVQRPSFSERWDAPTWLAGLEYRWSDELFSYAKASTGYRSGGWNGRGSFINELEVPFDEELVTAYELGVKADWFDVVRTNAALFYQRYRDTQTIDFRPSGPSFATLIVNSGSADISGGELEFWAQLLPGTTLSGFLGWNWFRFDDSSRRAENNPRLTAGLSVEHALPVLPLGRLIARLDYRTQSHSYASGSLVTPNFGILDGRLSLGLPQRPIEIALIGTNLFDREYFTAGIDFIPSGFGYQTRSYAPGRQLALELTWRFGAEAQ